jgi:hypothetical protein
VSSPIHLPRRVDIALPFLGVGGLVYVCLSLPAVGQRGYPPIDPIWVGVTYLWIAPIALSAIFDSYRFRSRRRQLLIYSLVTAFFYSGTFVNVVPHTPDPVGMLLSVPILGPLHFLVALALDAAIQRLLRRSRTLVEATPAEWSRLPRIPLAAMVLGYSIICLTVGFPFAYRAHAVDEQRRRGAALADEEWRNGSATFYGDRYEELEEPTSGVFVTYSGDRETGLPLRPKRPDFGFSEAYNLRIRELLRRHGRPDWSLKENIPTAAKLASELTASDMTEVTQFPHEVTPNIVLARGGTLTRWGSTWGSDGDSLKIVTKHGGLTSMAVGVRAVSVKRDGDLVYIRDGQTWLSVYHQDGREIANVRK